MEGLIIRLGNKKNINCILGIIVELLYYLVFLFLWILCVFFNNKFILGINYLKKNSYL